jgi:hypothetical protein
MSLPDLAARYCRSESRDDLARAALDFSAGRADRTMLLSVTGDRAGVWHERGLGLTNEKRRSIGIQVTSEALFRLPMGDDHFYGALPAGQDVHSFYRTLGVEAPQEVLLIPVRVDDLLVAVALLDGGPKGRVHANVHEFLTAFRGLGLSFSLLATRRKIRDAMGAETRIAVAQ